MFCLGRRGNSAIELAQYIITVINVYQPTDNLGKVLIVLSIR